MSVRAGLLALVLAAAPPAFAQCEPVPLATPAGYFQGASPEAVARVNRVYDRIAEVAGIRPELVICLDSRPNAFARETHRQLVLGITSELLRLADTDDQVASVLAHEFGHFQLRHADARRDAMRDAYRVAVSRARASLRRGETMERTALRAATDFNEEYSSFSRAAEREADDDGFRLMMKARYGASGARELMEKMGSRLGTAQLGYFASHPGLGERAQYSKVLEDNERYREQAEALAMRRDIPALQALTDKWLKDIPGSGAALFYRAVLMRWAGRPPKDVAATLEESVLRYDGDGLSKLAQGYQIEGDQALLSYCTLLHFEGRTVQTLHCLEALPASDVEVFKKITGWSSFILTTKRPRDTIARTIHVGKASDGEVVFSNCSQTIEVNGLRIARSWTPAREGKPGGGTTQYLRCDRGCNCEPVTDAATLEAVRRALGS